jgi:hypothetical protein
LGRPGTGCAVGFSLGAGGGIFVGGIIGIGATNTGVAGAIVCGCWGNVRLIGPVFVVFVRSNPW